MENLIISDECTIIDSFKKMDNCKRKLLLLYTNNKFKNLLSIGDLQRALVKGYSIDTKIKDIDVAKKEMGFEEEPRSTVILKLKKMRSEYIPIMSKNNTILDIIYWEDLGEENSSQALADIPVVIMAGGKGSRLKPITDIIPKALIPIKNKPIIHCIMDNFNQYGSKIFYLCVNFKWKMLKDYFDEKQLEFNVNYIKEDKPLGTAGSLSLLKKSIDTTFFISNCDVLVDDNYESALKYHKNNKNLITIVSCFKSYHIPYGILERDKDGLLSQIIEKPNLNYLINTGMYIVEPSVLSHLPENKYLDMNQLIDLVKSGIGNVGVFPISEGSWSDIGEWSEYIKNYS